MQSQKNHKIVVEYLCTASFLEVIDTLIYIYIIQQLQVNLLTILLIQNIPNFTNSKPIKISDTIDTSISCCKSFPALGNSYFLYSKDKRQKKNLQDRCSKCKSNSPRN